MDFANAKFNDCDCEISYCDYNYYGEAQPQENQERYNAQNTLDTLLNDTYTIHEWELSNSCPLEKCVTSTKYLAHKLSRQKIIEYMQVFNKCECCSRHTERNDLPDLPKRAIHIKQHEDPSACHCNCRHNIRNINRALAIIL